MTSIDNNDFDDDNLIFTMDPLNTNDDNKPSLIQSDLSTSDYHSFVNTTDASLIIDSSSEKFKNANRKMFDITDLLGSSTLSFDDPHDICNIFDNLQPISTSSPSLRVVDYLYCQNLKYEQDIQWQIEQNCLKYDSKQLSPNDYLTRQTIYNRPIAYEKDTNSRGRNLFDNFKKTSINYSYTKLSPNESFDHSSYNEYFNDKRPQLFYKLTDSLDIIDGLLGTVISSF